MTSCRCVALWALVTLGSQPDAVHSTRCQPALVPGALWLGSRCPDPPEAGRAQPDLPATPQKPAEPTVTGELRPYLLRSGDARICEVSFWVWKTDSGGKQLKKKEGGKNSGTKALYLILVSSDARCAQDWARDTWEMTVITYPRERPHAALEVSRANTPPLCRAGSRGAGGLPKAREMPAPGILRPASGGATPKSRTLGSGRGDARKQVGREAWRPHQVLRPKAPLPPGRRSLRGREDPRSVSVSGRPPCLPNLNAWLWFTEDILP